MKKTFLFLVFGLLSITTFGQTLVTEGFEHAGVFPPSGWLSTALPTYNWASVTGTGGSPTTTGPHGGTYYAKWASYSYCSGNAMLVTPVVDWSNRGGVATTVTIWWWRDGVSYQGDLTEGVTVYVNTAPNITGGTSIGFVPRASNVAISGTVTGTSMPGTGTSGWYQYTFTVPTTFNTSTNYLIFYASTQCGDNCYMDDIAYTTYPGCAAPAISGASTACVGATMPLSDATTGGTWTSGTTTVATINSATGVVTGVATGTSSINYVVGGCSASKTITVNPSPVATATATPSVICSGGSTSLNVTATNPGATYGVSSIAYSLASQTSPATATFSSYDDGTTAVSLPFTFNYFGTNYSTINLCTNGYVQLGGASTTYSVAAFPSSLVPGAIALFWSDLDVLSPGAITYSTEGTTPNRTFVIKYNQVSPCCSFSDSYDGEVILYETSNNIDILVSKAASGTHTCGVQDASYTTGVTPPGRNAASYSVTTPEAWRFSMPAPSFAWTADATLSSTTIANPTASSLSSSKVYTVTATASNGCKGLTTVSVNVSPSPAPLTGIASVCQTGTTTLTSTAGGTWASSNSGIASVVTGTTTTGIVTGVAPGSATITYSFGSSCYVTMNVTVLATAPVTGPSSVCPGLTISLSDALTGGTWTSNNTSLATVIPSTGVVTGIAAGSPSIIYTLPNGCPRNTVITVNPLPAPFTGSTTVCKGLTTDLTETSTGGAWSSSLTTVATVAVTSATIGTVTGVDAGTATITYTLPTSCIMTTSVLVNPLPVPITSTGGSCVTDPVNPTVTLVDGTSGGSWSVSNTALATIISFSGQITGVAPGALTVTYTLPTTCLITTPYTINPLPAAISGTQVLCSNAITYLTNTSTGGIWSSSNAGLATVGSGTGIVSGVSGLSNPVISYTLPTGCLALSTITVNPAPGTTIGNPNVCVNSTTTLTVGGGCTWTSSNPGLATVSPGPSTSAVVTGVVAGNPVITYTLPGTGCFGTTAVTVNPLPVAITGPNGVCFGSTITLNDATTGGVWSSGTPATATISGSGVVTPVLAGGGPVTMNYTLGTGCKTTYPVTVNPLPVAYPVSPGGTSGYCAGTTGIDVYMSTTTAGVNYQLLIGGIPTGSALPGGGLVDFGIQTTAAAYTVVGTNATTGCVKNMTGSPVIGINPAPAIYNLSFIGASSNYCDVPGAGVDLTLSGSTPGEFYTLFLNGGYVMSMVGTGGILDFGPQSILGKYTAMADNGTCQSNMTGSVTVGKNPLPLPQTVTVQDLGLGAGNFCASGTGVHIGLMFASTGVDYQLWDTTANILLSTVSGANSSLDFGAWSVPSGSTHVFNVVGINSITSCSDNMNNYVSVTSIPLPTVYSVSAPSGSNYCIGGNGVDIELNSSDNDVNYQLYNGSAWVASLPGTTSSLYFTNNKTAGIYTIVAVDGITKCASTMAGSVNVNTYPALTIYTLTVDAPGSVCTGDSLHVRLSGSTPGISYKLYNNLTLVDNVTGTGAPLDFGKWANSGTYTVVAENMITLCTSNMIGSPTITVNSLPSVYAVSATNSGNYCAGGTGQHINLSFSDIGVTYQLYFGGTKIGSTVAGSGASIDFGTFTAPGTYTVTGANSLTGCTSNMSGSAVITINPLPSVYTVTGGGSYCAGSTTGVPVGLTNSHTGINYQLFNGAAQVGIPLVGTGYALNFGLQTATGSYTVAATDATTGCTLNMSGSKVITIDPLPNVYAMTGGGAYCGGGTGVHVGLSNSTTGIRYQLSNGGTLISTLTGTTGMPLDFGLQIAAGAYTVTASNLLTSCGSNMTGTTTVVINSVPLVYTVKGGGSYCAGGAGSPVYLSGSEPGVNYQLYNGGTLSGSPVMGTGTTLSLGSQTTAGTYTVIGYNAGTGCSTNMTGSTTVSINSLPAVYTVTGGGTMCAGGTGYHIILSGSATGISYQLLNSGLGVSTKTGTGAALDFGAQTTGGTYTVTATNTTTGCVSNMSGSGTIVVNPAPAAFAVTGGGHYCADASGVPVGLAGSVPGINYQLYNGGTPSGMPVGGTGTILGFGLQTAAGTYTITGTDMTSTCTGNMTGSVAVAVDPMVTPSVSITGTDGTACIGQLTNYTANAVNGGTAPSYVWKVGTATVSMTGSYSYIPTNGDVVSVAMTSNANCASPAIVTTSVKMNVIPYVMPSATVATDPGNTICQGTPITFTATPVLGGTAPGYSWLMNNVFVGTGLSYSYTPTTGNNGDVITFMLRSNERCRMMDTVFSEPVAMNVDDAAAPVVTLQSHLGKIVGVGLVDTFTAILAKPIPPGTYTFQWFINGSVVNGETMPIFINHNVFNNDNVSVIVTRNGACGNQSGTGKVTVQLHNLGATLVTSTGSNISVLPNPSKGEFTVKGTLGTSNEEEVSLEIANMLGQVIYKDKVMTHNGNINEHIRLSNTLANGMYILNLHSDSANDVFHIVIEQ